MRRLWQQIRWRIVFAQAFLVLVSVGIVLLMTRIIFLANAENVIRPILTQISENPTDGLLIQTVETSLLDNIRNTVLASVGVAMLVALVVGIGTSFYLWQDILRPLDNLAQSTRRIADGRYDERVDVPSSMELSQVADNFNQMTKALEEVEHKRITMIGNVTHELRTPLTGLQGYVEGLADGVFPADNETFELMENEIGRLSRLVNDIQTLSRVESGAIDLKPSGFVLAVLVNQVVAQLQPQAITKNQTLEIDNQIGALTLNADSDRVAQILTNLIANAIRYTPENGTILVRLRQDGDLLAMRVVDSGIGIPKQEIAYIFERFYRVDRSRSRKSGGSGVGLTISRFLARAMGGDIQVESSIVNRGTTFLFTLPSNP